MLEFGETTGGTGGGVGVGSEGIMTGNGTPEGHVYDDDHFWYWEAGVGTEGGLPVHRGGVDDPFFGGVGAGVIAPGDCPV